MAHEILPDQFEFVAVTTDTLLGVAMPDTVVGVVSTGGGVLETGGEILAVELSPLHALSNVTSVTVQRPRPNLRLLLIIECSHLLRKGRGEKIGRSVEKL